MDSPLKRVVLIVLDGCGVGPLPDAASYGDQQADTLTHALAAAPNLEFPHLTRLGLGHLHPQCGLSTSQPPTASYGRLLERSAGKDTATGHWELMGVVTDTPFITFPQGFPPALIEAFSERIGRGVLGNRPASGTEIIQELGALHQDSGSVIVYTSGDSVFQIAAHEETVPLEELYRICEIAYSLVTPAGVARVIARPFRGLPGAYFRTENRHDYTVPPPRRTVLHALKEAGRQVTGVGKIRDIYASEGITDHIQAGNNRDITAGTLRALQDGRGGLIFANLVDFDMLFGHRRDAVGFAGALKAFDNALPSLINELTDSDLLLLTADHGNDPTAAGTDHTREFIPLLALYPGRATGCSLGVRESFADIGATVAQALGVPWSGPGASFLPEVLS